MWQRRFPNLREIRSLSFGVADGYDDCRANLFEKT
jgi:hypothetical protein